MPQHLHHCEDVHCRDDCGNVTQGEQVIEVQDTTAPSLTIPEDYAAECSEEHPLEDAVFNDNCEGVQLTVMTDTIQGA